MDVSTQFRQDEAKVIVYGPEEGMNFVSAETHFLSVKERVEDWDRLNCMEEVVEPAGGMVKKARRSSDRFMKLTECFEMSEQGGRGEIVLSELGRVDIDMADNKHLQSSKFKFNNFSEILAKFSPGGGRVPRLRQRKLRVGCEGRISLDNKLTNEKRAFECVGNYPGFEVKKQKKLKVSPM